MPEMLTASADTVQRLLNCQNNMHVKTSEEDRLFLIELLENRKSKKSVLKRPINKIIKELKTQSGDK